jgi:hypothetical protein
MIAAVSAGRSKGGRCCCSQDAILFIVQQWLILVLHGRMRYWNPVRVSMWAPMVKHGNFVLDLPDQNCARGLRRQHSLPLLPIWKLVHSQTLGLWIAYESLCACAQLTYMKACALANDWLMNSLWKLVRLYMMSMSNVTWMRYMTTYCVSLQLALMDELCLLVCVLLCLFLSWWATSKVVWCWTKRLTYCCVKHEKFRLTVPRPQVPQESMRSPYFGAWGVLYDAMW